MGKTKSKSIRRTARTFLEKGVEFTDEFRDNKKILGKTMPSRQLKNQMAGFLTRTKKQEKQKEAELLEKKK